MPNASALLTEDPVSQVEVNQWLDYSLALFTKESDLASLSKVEANLLIKSYLVGNSYTAADVSLMLVLKELVEHVQNYTNIKRWFTLMQSKLNMDHIVSFERKPTIFYVSDSSPPIPTTILNQPSSEKHPSPSSDETQAVVEEAPKKEKKEKKKDKTSKVDSVEGDGGEGGDGKTAPAALNPMKLDIRVGVIIKCWDHPEAEKLLCEEIDVGEEVPRTIASGLRAFYKAEDMVGKRVIILANLKERSLVGFKSQGMVLCACNPDHSDVKLVTPPEDAKPGDRISFPGFEGAPATASEVAKKNILGLLAPQLGTDASGVANWQGVPFSVAGGVCTSELAGAAVS